MSLVIGIRYYCKGCGWSYVDNLTAAATTICPKCFGSSFSTEKKQFPNRSESAK